MLSSKKSFKGVKKINLSQNDLIDDDEEDEDDYYLNKNKHLNKSCSDIDFNVTKLNKNEIDGDEDDNNICSRKVSIKPYHKSDDTFVNDTNNNTNQQNINNTSESKRAAKRTTKLSFKLLQSARSTSFSLLSIDRLKRLRSKQRSTSGINSDDNSFTTYNNNDVSSSNQLDNSNNNICNGSLNCVNNVNMNNNLSSVNKMKFVAKIF